MKSQLSNPNEERGLRTLEIGIWDFIGIWDLVIGILQGFHLSFVSPIIDRYITLVFQNHH
jgi:hypothetical protein